MPISKWMFLLSSAMVTICAATSMRADVRPADVPAETDLAEVSFKRPGKRDPHVYVTPQGADSCRKKPGPAAGPVSSGKSCLPLVIYFQALYYVCGCFYEWNTEGDIIQCIADEL